VSIQQAFVDNIYAGLSATYQRVKEAKKKIKQQKNSISESNSKQAIGDGDKQNPTLFTKAEAQVALRELSSPPKTSSLPDDTRRNNLKQVGLNYMVFNGKPAQYKNIYKATPEIYKATLSKKIESKVVKTLTETEKKRFIKHFEELTGEEPTAKRLEQVLIEAQHDQRQRQSEWLNYLTRGFDNLNRNNPLNKILQHWIYESVSTLYADYNASASNHENMTSLKKVSFLKRKNETCIRDFPELDKPALKQVVEAMNIYYQALENKQEPNFSNFKESEKLQHIFKDKVSFANLYAHFINQNLAEVDLKQKEGRWVAYKAHGFYSTDKLAEDLGNHQTGVCITSKPTLASMFKDENTFYVYFTKRNQDSKDEVPRAIIRTEINLKLKDEVAEIAGLTPRQNLDPEIANKLTVTELKDFTKKLGLEFPAQLEAEISRNKALNDIYKKVSKPELDGQVSNSELSSSNDSKLSLTELKFLYNIDQPATVHNATRKYNPAIEIIKLRDAKSDLVNIINQLDGENSIKPDEIALNPEDINDKTKFFYDNSFKETHMQQALKLDHPKMLDFAKDKPYILNQFNSEGNPILHYLVDMHMMHKDSELLRKEHAMIDKVVDLGVDYEKANANQVNFFDYAEEVRYDLADYLMDKVYEEDLDDT
jgi:hypothetical protein